MSDDGNLRLGILASGTGTNFEAIVEAIDNRRLDARIAVLVCNRVEAPVIAKARSRGIETVLLSSKDHASRSDFDSALADVLQRHRVQLVVMAGFDRLVTPALLSRFPDRVINIHPALLPAFKGLDAQRQATEYGVKIAGATVHLVDEQMDHGPIIAQAAIAIAGGDDTETVRRRILAQEHDLYPMAIQLFAEDRIEVDGRKVKVRGETTPARDGALVSPTIAGGGAPQRTSR